MSRYASLAAATEHLEPPFAVVDLDALRSQRARPGPAGRRQADPGGQQVGALPGDPATASWRWTGYRGVLAFTLPEALWLADRVEDVVVGYPTADRDGPAHAGARRAAGRGGSRSWSTREEQLDFVETVVGPRAVRRSGSASTSTPRCGCSAAGCTWACAARRCTPRRPRTPRRAVVRPSRRSGCRAHGLRGPDRRRRRQRRLAGPAGRRSAPCSALSAARAAPNGGPRSVAAVRAVASRSSSSTAAAPAASRRPPPRTRSPRSPPARGSTRPALFDGYRALPARARGVLRARGRTTPAPGASSPSLGGGWIASGPAGADRLPTPRGPADSGCCGDGGRRRGADAAASAPAAPAAGRRPGLVPARQGRRAVRAGERAAPRPRRRGRRRGPHLPRRGPGLPLTAAGRAQTRPRRSRTRVVSRVAAAESYCGSDESANRCTFPG